MIDFLVEYWQYIVTTVAGGGLSSILTMRIGVKSAKTDVAAKVQEVYGKIIDSLEKRIEKLEELGCLDKGCNKRKRL